MRRTAWRSAVLSSVACVTQMVWAAPAISTYSPRGSSAANCRVGQFGRMSAPPLMKVAGICRSAISRKRVGRLMYSRHSRLPVHCLVGRELDAPEVFAFFLQSAMVGGTPAAVIEQIAPGDSDQPAYLGRMPQRECQGGIRAEAVPGDDAAFGRMSGTYRVGVKQQRVQSVVAVPVGAPAAAWLEANHPAQVVDHARDRAQVVVAAGAAIEHQ